MSNSKNAVGARLGRWHPIDIKRMSIGAKFSWGFGAIGLILYFVGVFLPVETDIIGGVIVVLSIVIGIEDYLLRYYTERSLKSCKRCQIDSFSVLASNDNYFLQHPAVQEKGMLQVRSFHSDMESYRRGIIPIRSCHFLRDFATTLTKIFDEIKMDVFEIVPPTLWPMAGISETRMKMFRKHVTFLANEIGPNVELRLIFLFSSEEDFISDHNALISIAYHWWHVTDTKLAAYYKGIQRQTKPREIWYINAKRGKKGEECLAVVPNVNIGEHFRDSPEPTCFFYLDKENFPRAESELLASWLNSLDGSKDGQLEVVKLTHDGVTNYLEQIHQEYKVLKKLRNVWFSTSEAICVTDCTLVSNRLGNWVENHLYQEILNISATVASQDGRDITRIFSHDFSDMTPVSKKRTAIRILLLHLQRGVKIGLFDVNDLPPQLQGKEPEDFIRDFNFVADGNTGFELTEYRGGNPPPELKYDLAEYGEANKSEFNELKELFAILMAHCKNSSVTSAIAVDTDDIITAQNQFEQYFGIQ